MSVEGLELTWKSSCVRYASPPPSTLPSHGDTTTAALNCASTILGVTHAVVRPYSVQAACGEDSRIERSL